MRTSSILKEVLIDLEFSKINSSVNFRYVCCNFEEIANKTKSYDSEKIYQFLDFVRDLLGYHHRGATLANWLHDNGHITFDEFKQARVFGSPEYLKLQQTRIEWVKWMIEQFEAKGD